MTQLTATQQQFQELSTDELIELGLLHAPTVGSVEAAQSQDEDLIIAEALEIMGARIISLDPDESDDMELIEGIESKHCAFVGRDERGYWISNVWLIGERYSTEEMAAIAYYQVEDRMRLLAAIAAAKTIVAGRMALTDYM